MANSTFGEDICAVVLDIGSHWTRAGYAGEDLPSTLVRSALGYLGEDEDGDQTMKDETSSTSTKCVQPKLADEGWNHAMNIREPVQDRVVQDWQSYEDFLTNLYASKLRVSSTQHPLLLSESSWLPRASRERLCEFAFETLGVPALYLVRDSVLTSFALGKPSALVIDSSASCTSVTPVYDGYTINKAIQKSPLGGDFLSRECQNLHERVSKDIPFTARYKVASREPVAQSQAPIFKPRELSGTKESFDRYMLRDLWNEFKQGVVAVVPDSRYDEEGCKKRFSKPFEFPNGYNELYHLSRFKLGEIFFQPAEFSNTLEPGSIAPPIHRLVHDAVSLCDVDIRSLLYANIVVTGGNSLVPGFVERLDLELQWSAPQARLRIAAPSNTWERRFSSWIGGSILGSLATFHQMWIGKKDYEEYGRAIVERKCL